jgi:mRNA interferase MazF
MAMLKTVEGIYRQGKIELTDPPADVEDNTPVIVTFLGSGIADSQSDHVNLAHAADLRSRLLLSLRNGRVQRWTSTTTMMAPKPRYKRGDVVLVLFPNSTLRSVKPRPALVVQADNLETGLSQILIAMITSRMFRANHPSRVTAYLSAEDSNLTGLLTDSVVMTDNLATVDDSAIARTSGQSGSFPWLRSTQRFDTLWVYNSAEARNG